MTKCNCSCHGPGPYDSSVVVFDGKPIVPCIVCAGHHYRDKLNARLAIGEEALALLREIDDPFVQSGSASHCFFCGAGYYFGTPVLHDDDCLWLRIQAFLNGLDG